MVKEIFSIINLVNDDGCFDLQFRKDTRHERTGSPTYYRWKIQFIITTPKANNLLLEKASAIMGVGNVSIVGSQARLSVQKIEDITETVIPFFTKNKLSGSKKSEFTLWQKAAAIIYKNKGVYLSKWQKSDLSNLMEIHQAMAKYKLKPRKQKWSEMAQVISRKEG